MVNRIFLFSALFVMTLCISCVHKSGHRKKVSYSSAISRNSSASSDEDAKIDTEPTKFGQVLSGRDIFKKYDTAVVMVFTSNGLEEFQGSGFFLNSKGLAVSNYHVFKGTEIGEEKIKLADSDQIYHVERVYAKSDDKDFILFKVDCDHTNYIPIAQGQPEVGDQVFAIGSPRGLENTFSSGEVSQWRDKDLMQINALIDHGSSGGALINDRGEVVGITSGTFYDGSQANLNYAWSIDVIKPYLK